MPITPTPHIWLNGNLVPWEQAQVHVLTHALHYGSGVFEGLRAYATPDGPAIFRLSDHMLRLQRSARILGLPLTWDAAALMAACRAVVRSSGLDSCYVRVLAYLGVGEMGLNTVPFDHMDVAIACWSWQNLHAPARREAGLRLKVSSWRRHDHNIIPPLAKGTGGYVNSSLAQSEAVRAGYDGAVLLNPQGFVAECAGENIFAVHGDRLVTPPVSAGALDGITLATVCRLATDLGIPVARTELSRADLYVADEVFTCGTAAEIGPIRSIDDRPLPCPGPRTSQLAALYSDVVRGQVPAYAEWVDHCAA